MAETIRPRYIPSPCDPLDSPLDASWTPLISCPADFPPELFETAISQLIHHPEYNSTLILRSDTLAEHTPAPDDPAVPALPGLVPVRTVHRRLLARRPGRDASLEQYCTLYAPAHDPAHGPPPPVHTLVLTPLLPPGHTLPYYHPAVFHLAFRYLPAATAPAAPARLRIEAQPLLGAPTDPSARLYRTCLALLETLHRYGWGAVAHYRKRVVHDCLVPRAAYQDLYLLMRARHGGLVHTWREVTDPLKHVFEDIGIATYLMLLWKDTYGGTPDPADARGGLDAQEAGEPSRPWDAWPRPPGGFLDLGCGNGLLTHILAAEGYAGHGIDLRARASWAHYPPATQARLHVRALDPTLLPSDRDADPRGPAPYLPPPGAFIIGNHADELTPWVPVLATLHRAAGYLSVPCCAWGFDARYERAGAGAALFAVPPVAAAAAGEGEGGTIAAEEADPDPDPAAFADSLNLGGAGSRGSAYSMYRIWLATLSAHCGWEVECEALRIPSTRNWAIVGRTRSSTTGRMDAAAALDNALRIVRGVRERGIFKTRRPEGKAGADH